MPIVQNTAVLYSYNGLSAENYFDVYNGLTEGTKLGDPASGTWVMEFSAAGMSYDGKYIGGWDGGHNTLPIYDISGSTITRIANITATNTAGQKNIAEFSRDGRWLLVAGANAPRNAPYSYLIDTTTFSFSQLPSELTGAGNEYSTGCFNAQGTRLFVTDSTSSPPVIKAWSISGTTFTYLGVVFTFTGTEKTQGKMALSPDGTRMAVCRNGKVLTMIDVGSSGTALTLNLDNPMSSLGGSGTSCSFSPDGSTVAFTASVSPYVGTCLWNSTGPQTNFSNLPTSSGGGCAWSIDGTEVLWVGPSVTTAGDVWAYNVATRARTVRSLSSAPTKAFNILTGGITTGIAGAITTSLTKASIKTLTGSVVVQPAGTIRTNLTKASMSAVAKEIFSGIVRTNLSKVSMTANGTDKPRIAGTMTTALSRLSQALTSITIATRGNITTRLPSLSQIVTGKTDVRGMMTTALRPTTMALVGKTDIRGAIQTKLSHVNISAAGLHIITGALRTDLFPQGLQMTITARAFEIFTGTIVTNLQTFNIRQELQGLEIEQGSITTHLGNAGQLVASEIKAEQRILGPIVTHLHPVHSSLLGAKLGAAGEGDWYSWRYRDS